MKKNWKNIYIYKLMFSISFSLKALYTWEWIIHICLNDYEVHLRKRVRLIEDYERKDDRNKYHDHDNRHHWNKRLMKFSNSIFRLWLSTKWILSHHFLTLKHLLIIWLFLRKQSLLIILFCNQSLSFTVFSSRL